MTIDDPRPGTEHPNAESGPSLLASRAVAMVTETFTAFRSQLEAEAAAQVAHSAAERERLVASIEGRLTGLEGQLTELRGAHDDMISENDSLMEKKQELQAERDQLQQQLQKEREELERVARDSSKAASAVQARLTQELQQATDNLEAAQQKEAELVAQLKASRDQVDDLEVRVASGSTALPADIEALRSLAPMLRQALAIIDGLGPVDAKAESGASPGDFPKPVPPDPRQAPHQTAAPLRKSLLPVYELEPSTDFARPVITKGLMLFNGWVSGTHPEDLLAAARDWVIHAKNGSRRADIDPRWTPSTLAEDGDYVGRRAAVRIRRSPDGRSFFLHFHHVIEGGRWHTLLEVIARGSGSIVRIWSGADADIDRVPRLGSLPYFLRDTLQKVATMGPGFPYATDRRINLSDRDVKDLMRFYTQGAGRYFSTVFLGSESHFPGDLQNSLLLRGRIPSNPALFFTLQDREAATALHEALSILHPEARITRSSKAVSRQVTFVSATGGVRTWDRPRVQAFHEENRFGFALLSTLADIDARWLELAPSIAGE